MGAGIMREFRPEVFLQNRGTLWIVSVLIILLFLLTNLPWHLDNYDQAKQAFTSFEIVKEGHWLYQRTPQERVATKPPLLAWISTGLFALTRSWDVAWRLPSLLCACGLSILLFRAAKDACGAVAGLIALSAFGLNLLSPRLATLVRTDMPLAFVIFLLGRLIWQKIRKREEWHARDQWSIFALLTAGMLIKGPIVYAFLLPGIALFQWRARIRLRQGYSESLREQAGATGEEEIGSAWCGWWPWVASLGIFLLWVIGGILLEPRFFDQVVVREFIGRFGETVHRPQPIYFYLPHLLHKFAPWSVLMIVLAVWHLRTHTNSIRASLRKISPETFWLICWSLGGLLVMSLIPSKRVDRIFPVIPPLCLLLAAQVRSGRDAALRRPVGAARRPYQSAAQFYRWSAVALLVSMLFAGGYTIVKVVSGYRNHRDALVKFGRAVRQEAAMHQWRYEAISGRNEGLLLYLDKTRFIQPDRAVAEWNRGNLDALVVPIDEAPRIVRDLENASISGLRTLERKGGRRMDYVLITR